MNPKGSKETGSLVSKSITYPAVIFILIASLANQVWAGLNLTAETDRQSMQVGERFTYTITLTGTGDLPEILPPALDEFQLISGPSSSTNIQIINRDVTKSQTLSYDLRSISPGEFLIPPAHTKSRNAKKRISSNSIKIHVTPAGVSPGNVNSQRSIKKKEMPDVFLRAVVDKDTAYRMEMISVSYDLYLRVDVVNYEIVKLPQATGFWREQFETSTRPVLRDVHVGGKPYKVATIRKEGLFPTRTGDLQIQPLTIDCSVRIADRRRRRSRDPFDVFSDDFFGFSRQKTEVRTISCDPVDLTILEFPKTGKPGNFDGDVGEFSMKTVFDRNELTQHDALSIKVTINGKGYLKSIDAPDLVLPSGFEQFDPTVEESISLSGQKMRGKKTFTYLVIPRRPGEFRLQPIEFSFFNPRLKKYVNLSSGTKSLKVLPADANALTGSGYIPNEVALVDSDIRFIKELKSPLTGVSIPAYRSMWFYFALGAAPLLFIAGLIMERVQMLRNNDPMLIKRRQAPEKMRKSLKEVNKLIKSDDLSKTIRIMNRSLMDYIGALVNEPAAGLTSEMVIDLMTERKIDEELVNEVIGIIETTNLIEFSGVIPKLEEVETIYNQCVSLSEKLSNMKLVD